MKPEQKRPSAAPRPAAAPVSVVVELQRSLGNAAFGRRLRARPNAAVLARVTAQVYLGDSRKPLADEESPKGGQGGVSHAEQKAWAKVRHTVENKFERRHEVDPILINFAVDGTVCPPCMTWFEQNLYGELTHLSNASKKRPFRLTVTRYEGNKVAAEVVVTGAGTNWNGVGDQARAPEARR